MSLLTRRRFIQTGIGAAAAGLLSPAPSWPGRFLQAGISNKRPNIILIMADDMGSSDLGCYGSEIDTPSLNMLAAGGMRFSQAYNCARCCPTRASLLTGLYPHQAGVGWMMDDHGFPGYRGDLNDRCVTIAEVLRESGYHTMMCGKWHVTPAKSKSKHNWPLQRGFEKYFGTIEGAGSYYDPVTLTRDNDAIRADLGRFYYTDAISENAVRYIDEYGRKPEPFFLYVAYTSPHWPLHAFPEDIAKYRNTYSKGWDALRRERHQKMIELGLVSKDWPLSPRDPRVPPWDFAVNKEWEARRMAVYAAQIDRMDRGVGTIAAELKELGVEDNTLILFLADNGGCAEELTSAWRRGIYIPDKTRDGRLVWLGNDPSLMPGPEDTYQSYGIGWANASNTPFRLYKHWAHEGGIATPLIAYWPAGIKEGNTISHRVAHVMDIMATCLDVANVPYPKTYQGREIIPLEGKSLLPVFERKEGEPHDAIYWEHEGNTAVRQQRWKLVARHPDYWELHDMEACRTELNNLIDKFPERARQMLVMYEQWAKRCGVKPWPLPD